MSEADKKSDVEPAEKHNTPDQIANGAGVSGRKVGQAEVVRNTDPELWEKAKQGDATINAAHVLSHNEKNSAGGGVRVDADI